MSNSTHFPLMVYSKFVKPVALPPGRARLWTKPAPTGSATFTNTIGMVRVACSAGPMVTLPTVMITSGASATSSAAYRRMAAASPPGRAIVDLQVSANRPAQLLEALLEHHDSCLRLRIVRREWHEHANAPHLPGLLRPCRERPCRCRTAEKHDELAPPH